MLNLADSVWITAAGNSYFCGGKILEISQTKQTPISLTEYLAVFEDPSLTLTQTDVQKADIAARFKTDFPAAEAISFDYSRSAYWLRLTLHNTSDHPLERMLEIGYPLLSNVQFYQPMASGAYQSITTGLALPFATRPYPNRYFVFPITVLAHTEQAYYLRIQATDAIIVPARLWEPQDFHRYERNDYLAQAWYFGMATAMILFNLLLFIALRDVIYLLYISFVSCMTLTIASQNGLSKEFLWPNAMLWSDISQFICDSLIFVTWLLFMRRMLNTQTVIPKLDRFLKVMVGINLFTLVGFAVSLQTFAESVVLLYLTSIIFVLGVGLFCTFKRQRSAYFFVIASTVLCFAAVITALNNLGFLPTNFLTVNALQFGSTLEMLLLAFALADRFNEIRRQKEIAQNQVLAAQQHLVENLQSSERILETRVAERTAELHTLNRKLEALSMTDGLTGIANRRHFDDVLAREWDRALRLNQPLALAILDVDWFKKYNDHYGHQEGDDCLRSVAAILATNVCRTGDLVARYGGEEFVFIAPATDGDNALTMAKKVCETLQALTLPHEMSEFGCVTFSIGVAAIIPSKENTLDSLVKAADDALYRAKAQGRNRAVLAT
ncbi:MAG: sensor domain-containing diguanylate cyclase [Methylococcaceae bacterium]|nr:sensor domain-containing diguanylate cyclase [Methylococcaceae bacterium]